MMTDETGLAERLNTGLGLCALEARVDLDLAPVAAELGAAADFFQTVLHAVHDVNRRDPENARIAVAFPGLRPRASGWYAFGDRVRLFGAEPLLARVIATDRIETAVRRGLVDRQPRVFGVSVNAGVPGTAFVRARAGARVTEGELRRKIARHTRKGWDTRALEANLAKVTPESVARAEARALHITMGPRQLSFEPVACAVPARVEVSTYGFSNASAPGGLPVRPGGGIDG